MRGCVRLFLRAALAWMGKDHSSLLSCSWMLKHVVNVKAVALNQNCTLEVDFFFAVLYHGFRGVINLLQLPSLLGSVLTSIGPWSSVFLYEPRSTRCESELPRPRTNIRPVVVRMWCFLIWYVYSYLPLGTESFVAKVCLNSFSRETESLSEDLFCFRFYNE